MPDHARVRISVASMLQRFHGCEPDFIRDVCQGRCCDAPSRPGGSMVTIHRSEEASITARGGTVLNGLLVTEAGCTFKTDVHLCGLHHTDDKPFGCIASPFTLNAKDCLIVRNRYRMLPCYRTETSVPAYVAFAASLCLIFGGVAAADIVSMLATREAMGGDMDERFIWVDMPMEAYRMLHDNDLTKKSQKSSI